MTIISIENKFAFVHIYKCCGMTITHLLKNSNNKSHQIQCGHSDIRDLQTYFIENNLKFDEYFKFSAVRNPYDWIVSLYFYCKTDKKHMWYELVNKNSFDKFVEIHTNEHLNLPRIIGANRVQSQYEILMDYTGKINVDYILHKESLEKDILLLRDKKIIRKPLIVKNSLENKRNKDYMSYYTENTKKLIQKTFEKDFEAFGYDV